VCSRPKTVFHLKRAAFCRMVLNGCASAQQGGFGNKVLEKGKIVVALLWKNDSGCATSINDLAVALDPSHFKVLFLFLKERGEGPSRLEKAGHTVFYLSERGASKRVRVSALFRLAKILRTHGVDVLHCHNHKASFYGALAAIWARTPVVLVQSHGLRRTRNTARRVANLVVYRKARRIVAVADAVMQDILNSNWYAPREKLFVLENSVDYDRFAGTTVSQSEARQLLGVPLDATVVGTIGRLAATKGVPYLIDAFCIVKQRVSSAHLVLLGDGPSRGDLERQVARTPYRDFIHFLGYKPNVEVLLRGMDVFVLASVAEGMPRVILEAMAAGVPCVGTAVGGVPEMLDGGALGSLVEPRDPQSLARAVLDAIALSGQERQDRVGRMRQRVRTRYSHDVVRAKLARLYEEEYTKGEGV